MNNNVIEIVGLLIQKMLQDEEILINEENIIQELIELGYDIVDIDDAFELIYNGADIIEADNIELADFNEAGYYNRIFTMAERLYLPINFRGLIRRLMILNLLTPGENESFIVKLIQKSYEGTADTSDLWDILNEVVDDKKKLNIISTEIPEFKEYYPRDFKYIN